MKGCSPLRIAHVTNYQVPGYGYDEIQLGREQRRMGHEVIVITSNFLHPDGLYDVLRRRFPERHVDPRDEVVDGVRVQRLRSRELARRVWIGGLGKAIVDFKPEVVHVHNLLQFHLPRLAWLRATGRYAGAIVVDDHMHAGFVRRSPAGRAFYATYRGVGQPLLGRYVDRVSAIADDTRDYLRDECGVRADIAVIPLGVDVEAFAPSAELRQETRQRLGITGSTCVLLYTGKVIREKGVEMLVKAAQALEADGREMTVVAVGDADESYQRELEDEARTSQVNLRLVPSVAQGELPPYYAAADVAVWPRQESKAVFEAMSCAVPVVVSATSGLAHIVAPDRGFVYSPDDASGLATALRAVVADPVGARRVAQAGRDYAVSELSWSRSATRYVDLYREAIASRHPR
jgi:glycosyltransferase involved in cell wall biosynthesis